MQSTKHSSVVGLPLKKIVSGAQTGADRAALDWAIVRDIPHGGWCPRGRKAEDGAIPPQYRLDETPLTSYLQRTEWNARDSDGTAIFTMAATLSGGSRRTAQFADKHAKPWIHLAARGSDEAPAKRLAEFVLAHGIQRLNVAGSRGSKEPGVAMFVERTLEDAFYPRPKTSHSVASAPWANSQ
jgi:hypothetical protein